MICPIMMGEPEASCHVRSREHTSQREHAVIRIERKYYAALGGLPVGAEGMTIVLFPADNC